MAAASRISRIASRNFATACNAKALADSEAGLALADRAAGWAAGRLRSAASAVAGYICAPEVAEALEVKRDYQQFAAAAASPETKAASLESNQAAAAATSDGSPIRSSG